MNTAVPVCSRRCRGRAWHVPRLLGIVAALGLAASCGPQGPTASAAHQSPTVAASAGHQSPTASPGSTGSATPPSPGGCASQSHPANFPFSGSPVGSITVCPGRAAVGAVVRITLQGCNTPSRAPVALVFLGPSSWIGSGGGGGPVPFKMVGGGRFTASFTIPATYVGGETGAIPNPTLPVRPGDHYSFATYPVGICDVPFTVTGGIHNLVITSAVRSELTAAYAAYRRISPSDITGTEPGSVHYAYDQATDTYWALADFAPSLTAPPRVLVGFQDGVSWGFFTKVGSGPWRAQIGGEPVVCLEVRFFPRAVLAAWSLPTDTAIVRGCQQPEPVSGPGLGFCRGAGDGNRTRTVSLDSDRSRLIRPLSSRLWRASVAVSASSCPWLIARSTFAVFGLVTPVGSCHLVGATCHR